MRSAVEGPGVFRWEPALKGSSNEDKPLQKYAHYRRLRSFSSCNYPTRDKGEKHAITTGSRAVIPQRETRALHQAKLTDDPVQVAFAVTDDQGKEEIITGEVPYSYDLFRLLQENGWLNIRRGVASVRENRTQRRAMSA
jgi:hypothetical protein